MNDAQVRLRYLDETIRRLFPGTAGQATRPAADPTPGSAAGRWTSRSAGRSAGRSMGHRPYTLLPHAAVPRRLVPRAWWHAPLGSKIMVPSGGDTIEDHLREVLGLPVRVTLHVRPARRANRKPILSVCDPTGRRLAFVKIGDSARTRDLVRAEARALHLVADAAPATVVAPAVLHHGGWRDVEVLVLAPLPVPVRPWRRQVPAPLIERAVPEIAGLAPGSPWSWHGDFAPWNMAAARDGRLLVWDWERFQSGVPLGFDAVHLFFQHALARMGPQRAARACVARALRTLAPFGLSAAEARLTAIRYLIELAARHAADGHEPLGPPSTWLAPAVDHEETLI